MKKSTRGIALFLVILMLSSTCLTSCEGLFDTLNPSLPGDGTGNNPENPGSTTVIYSLELRASKTVAARGESITLSAYLKSTDKEEASDEAEFSIVEGSDYATLAGNVLTIKSTANHGDVIKLKAHEGITDSNIVTVTVNVPATELTIAAGGATNLLAGQSIVLTHAVSPVGADENVKFQITEGSDLAVISGNVLVVNQNAITGKTIKVKATVGNIESNELEFTVGYPLTALVVASPVTNILHGSSAQLSVVQTPINATNGDYTWEYLEGGDYAVIINDVLTLKPGAPTGATIKVRAVSGGVESNVLTFTVGYPLESLTLSYAGLTNLTSNNFVILSVSLNPTNATNGDYTWEYLEGGDYVTVINNMLTLKPGAPTGATVKIRAVSGDITSNTLEFTVGYPLETITVSSSQTNVTNSAPANISVTLNPTNATNGDYTWQFVEGEDYATVVNNMLTLKPGAPTGAIIKVRAVSGDITSNTLEFTVGYPLKTIAVSSSQTNIMSGSSVTVGVILNPTNTTNGDYTWEFLMGDEYATGDGKVITVKPNAPTGTIIKARAVSVSGDIKSNILEFTVGYPLESLTATLNGSANIENGKTAQLTVTKNPTNTTNGDYTWQFVEGSDFATIVGDYITISESAPVGSIIKIVAVSGNITSNTISIMVGTPIEEVSISTSAPEILERGETYAFSANVKPTDASMSALSWFVEGSEYVSISSSGVLTVGKNTPAGTKITVYAASGSVKSNEFTFTVGVKLDKIEITLNGSENVDPDGSRIISHTLFPSNASDTQVVWVIDKGAEFATLINGVLTVKSDAPIGETVTFHAEIGDVKSEPITITIGIVLDKIEITLNGSENVDPDGSRNISHTLFPSNATLKDVVWKIDEGADFATLVNGILTVKSGAPIGETVTFHAEIGDVKSEPITITIGIVLDKIEITLNGSENVDPDGSRNISHTLFPSNATLKDVVWVIDKGAEFATLINGVLTVKSGAPIGETVTFHAEIGSVKSEPITITVGTPITNIVIEAIGSTGIVKGNTVGLSADLTPGNANPALLSWTIIEGSEYAYIRGTTLVVKSDATTGAVIKVQATFRDVESNVLEFTVMPTQDEILNERYMIELSTNSIRLDKNGLNAPTLIASILNGHYQEVTNLPLEFKVIEGTEYLTVNQNGYNCTFTPLGHGEAVVEVRISGTDVAETVSVDVVVPPEAIVLPGPFAERPMFDYSFSLVDPLTGKTETLPFVPTVRGNSLVCQDLILSFVGEDGSTGDDVAVYENGEITFKKTGKVKVTVSSASGSRLEATASYTFNINEGYNANTFEELSFIIEHEVNDIPLYTGSLPINIVVLEKPIAPEGSSYEYGYDIVPSLVLTGEEQTMAKLLRAYTTYTASNGQKSSINLRIQAVNKGLWLNGNNHKIDVSQVRLFTYAEFEEYADYYKISETARKFPLISSLISVESFTDGGSGADDNAAINGKSYNIKLYDLEVEGNAPIDYNPNMYNAGHESASSGVFVGAFDKGIALGSYNYETYFYIDADNLAASKFHTGIHVRGIVGNGTISNMKVDNCYSTGIMVHSSIVTLKDITIGKCGATGIELAPEEANKAGLNSNEVSRVTITGKVNAESNLNNGESNYFNNYLIGGVATVPQVITGNLAMYTDSQNSHIRNEKGEFIFVTLVFNDYKTLTVNPSVLDYLAFDDEGGIIDMSELPKDGIDTTHKIISMSVYVPDLLGDFAVAKAYFYNHNYGLEVNPDTAE